jgi:hypothetical protein
LLETDPCRIQLTIWPFAPLPLSRDLSSGAWGRGTIAIDGEHSCDATEPRDRNATHAITPHRLAPRSHSGVVA